jgi:hypothetical protein
VWFVVGLSLSVVGALLFSAWTYLEVISKIAARKFWKKRISKPSIDHAIRRSRD